MSSEGPEVNHHIIITKCFTGEVNVFEFGYKLAQGMKLTREKAPVETHTIEYATIEGSEILSQSSYLRNIKLCITLNVHLNCNTLHVVIK